MATTVTKDPERGFCDVIYNNGAPLDFLLAMARDMGDRVSLWAREERTSITREMDLAELRTSLGKVNWFTRDQVPKLLTCIRFGLRRNRTLREVLEENDDEGRGVTLPLNILSAITTLIR